MIFLNLTVNVSYFRNNHFTHNVYNILEFIVERNIYYNKKSKYNKIAFKNSFNKLHSILILKQVIIILNKGYYELKYFLFIV